MKKRPASSSGGSRESLAQSSTSSSALSSSRAGHSSQSRSSIGWGWFEHNSSNVLADATKAHEGDRPKPGKSSKKKKKRGGLLQGFQSAILGEQIEIPINKNGEQI
jgi:hypothetical protein